MRAAAAARPTSACKSLANSPSSSISPSTAMRRVPAAAASTPIARFVAVGFAL